MNRSGQEQESKNGALPPEIKIHRIWPCKPQKALEDASILREEIDLILVATATPDRSFPSTACILQEKIGATKCCRHGFKRGMFRFYLWHDYRPAVY